MSLPQLALVGLAGVLGLPVPLGLPAQPGPGAAAVSAEAPGLSCTEAAVELELAAATRRLSATAQLRLAPGPGGMRTLVLHPGLVPQRLLLDDRPVAWRREGGRLVLALPTLTAPARLRVAYAGRPLEQVAGATLQDVEPRVALLRPSGSWWPRPEGAAPPMSLVVRLPEGWRAIALSPGGSFTREGRLARLKARAGEPVALVAGPFEPMSRAGFEGWAPRGAPQEVPEALSRLLRTRGLWPGALPTWIELPAGFAPASSRDAVAGPRPPGGGGAALAALCFTPRVPEGAAQPERALLVEALGAYLARLARSGGSPEGLMRGAEAAYASFLTASRGQDRPLREAFAAGAEAWAALVGEKGTLAWSLVHTTLGDEAFWAMLREWRAEVQAGRGTFRELLARAPQPLSWFDSWHLEAGLPALALEAVRVEPAEGGWRVTGTLVHRAGLHGVPTDLVLIAAEGTERVTFRTFAPRMPFAFSSRTRPLRLVIDSQERAPLVRRRHARIADAYAAPGALVVYGTAGDEATTRALREAAERVARSLVSRDGRGPVVRADRELTEAERAGDLILVGRPALNTVAAAWMDQLPVRFSPAGPGDGGGKGLWWQGRTWTRPEVGVVEAIANPLAPDRTVLLLAGLSPRSQLDAQRYVQRPGTFCLFDDRGVLEEGLTLRPFPDLEMALF